MKFGILRLGAIAALLLTASFSLYADKVSCASIQNDFNRCDYRGADRLNVELIHQESHAPCERDYTWGADSDGIWVDRGCRGIFQVSGAPNRDSERESGCPYGINGNECEYYMDGYNAGRQDGQNGQSMAYERHADDYDSRFESYFAQGYEEGWMRYR